MNKILFLIFTLGCTTLFHKAFAASSGGTDSCGLGWYITKKKTLSATSTRGTTNAFIPPTLGMTSGTINCDSHSIAKKDVPPLRYAAAYFDVLKHEIAIGSGNVLLGFSEIMGCSKFQDFSSSLRSHYTYIFPHGKATPVEVFQHIRSLSIKNCRI